MAARRTRRLYLWFMQQRAGLWIAALVAFILLAMEGAGMLQRLELYTYDMRMAWSRADTRLHPAISVILIDEGSLQAMDPLVGRFPWPRDVYADLLEYFSMAGARAVIFDVLFTERDETGGDARLAESTARNGRTVHAWQLFHNPHVEENGTSITSLPERFVEKNRSKLDGLSVVDFNNYFVIPHDALYLSAMSMGVVDVEPDVDGIYRRYRLFHEFQGENFPALGIAALQAGVEQGKQPYALNDKGQLVIHDRTLKIDPSRSVMVNHVDDLQADAFAAVYASLQALHRGDLSGLIIPPDDFQDKIIFIGASAVGLADIKATPLSPRAPGVTLHASMLSNLLTGDLLVAAPSWHTPVFTLFFIALTAVLVLMGSNVLVQGLVPLFLGMIYSAWSWWWFGQHVVYEMATPLLGIVVTAFVLWAFIAATEGRDKRRVRAMFSQYVSPAVLDQLSNGHHSVVQAEVGQMERLTVLFSDVRGFTSISEKLKPNQVVELLNIHFTVMSEIIFQHDGTLDKFIGDAIMAFWGAPIRVEQHAEQAVRAAVEMERGLQEVNQQLAANGYPSVAIGIGLNTGDSILGNIGSQRKLDYTVIGDTVNIASRLEGLTKLYGQGTVISEYTHSELPATFPCAVLDLVRVKGKTRPLGIYTPLGLPEDDSQSLKQAWLMVEQLNKAFSAYRAQRWDEAIALYHQLPSHQDTLGQLFIARCTAYKQNGPGEDWDGAYTMTSK